MSKRLVAGTLTACFVTLATVPEFRFKVEDTATDYGFAGGSGTSHGIIEFESGTTLLVPSTREAFDTFLYKSMDNDNYVSATYETSLLKWLKKEHTVSDFPNAAP